MNIYIRQQDNDLFKYLDDSELKQMQSYCLSKALNPGDTIADSQGIVMLEQGIMERIYSSGKVVGRLFPGEIDFESPLPYVLKAVIPSQISILEYAYLEQLDIPVIAAKIQAAINDALCLKIIRLTHKGEDDNAASE